MTEETPATDAIALRSSTWRDQIARRQIQAFEQMVFNPEFVRASDVYSVVGVLMQCQTVIPELSALFEQVARILDQQGRVAPAELGVDCDVTVRLRTRSGGYLCELRASDQFPRTVIVPAECFPEGEHTVGEVFFFPAGAKIGQHRPDVPEDQLASTQEQPDDSEATKTNWPVTYIAPEILADMAYAKEQLGRGAFNDRSEKYVAILNREIVGYGNSEEILRTVLAEQKKVLPGRFIVEYIGPWD